MSKVWKSKVKSPLVLTFSTIPSVRQLGLWTFRPLTFRHEIAINSAPFTRDMKPTTNHPGGELQELSHEPQPGYGKAFWIVLAVTTLILIAAAFLGMDVDTHH